MSALISCSCSYRKCGICVWYEQFTKYHISKNKTIRSWSLFNFEILRFFSQPHESSVLFMSINKFISVELKRYAQFIDLWLDKKLLKFIPQLDEVDFMHCIEKAKKRGYCNTERNSEVYGMLDNESIWMISMNKYGRKRRKEFATLPVIRSRIVCCWFFEWKNVCFKFHRLAILKQRKQKKTFICRFSNRLIDR